VVRFLGIPLPGAYSGRGLGVKTPTLFGKFFQFARFFKKKIPNPPPKISLPYKNISKTLPRNISKYAPDLYPYPILGCTLVGVLGY